MAEMFSHAASYEKVMGRWSARLAPLFVDFANVRDGNRVLDVGCGTGSLCQAVADITRGSEIVGIDPAQGFIDFCRSRFPDPRMSFDCGSALGLPYPNGAFDKSLSLLVLMFIPQPERAAAEMRRVTRPGGTVAGFDDYWLPMSASEPGGAYVATLFPDHCDALRTALQKRHFVDRPDGPFSLGALSWAVRGTVPK